MPQEVLAQWEFEENVNIIKERQSFSAFAYPLELQRLSKHMSSLFCALHLW